METPITPTTEVKPKRKKKNLGGRPIVFDEKVVEKLEEAFAMDCTVSEACLFAGIDRKTYYNNVKQGDELFLRFEALRDTPILKARSTIVRGLERSSSDAQWYLSRKRKAEFSEKTEVEVSGKLTISSVLDEIEKS